MNNPLLWTLGILTVLAAIAVIVLVALQNSKKGMSGVITGGNGGSYYDRNKSSSKEAVLNKVTIIACVVFALLVLSLFIAQYEPDDESSAKPNNTSKDVSEVSEVSETSKEEVSDEISELIENSATVETSANDTESK